MLRYLNLTAIYHLHLLVCLLLVQPTIAFAQNVEETSPPDLVQAGIQELNQAMIEAGYSALTRQHIRNTITTGVHQGIPKEVLSDKVFEGIAKHVPEKMVNPALTRVVNRHALAQKIAEGLTVDRPSSRAMIGIIVDSLRAGLTEDHAHELETALHLHAETRQLRPQESAAIGMETFTTAREWSRRRVPSTAVVEAIGLALKNDLGITGLQAMRTAMRERKGTINPDILAQHVSSAIRQGWGPKEIAELNSPGMESRLRGNHDSNDSGSSGSTGGSRGNSSSGDAGSNSSGGSGSSGGPGSSGGSGISGGSNSSSSSGGSKGSGTNASSSGQSSGSNSKSGSGSEGGNSSSGGTGSGGTGSGGAGSGGAGGSSGGKRH